MNDTVDVDGLTIAFERTGAGPVLVLLHGGASDRREWRGQLDGLADGFTVVAWDAPGCGGSTDPPQTFRMADYARVLDAFLERIGVERPHVLGLSWGSTLALELWRRRPEVPRSLVLAAPYAGWRGSLTPTERDRRLEAALADLERPPDEWIASFLGTLVTPDASEGARDALIEIMRSARPAGSRPMLLAMADADLRPALPTITVPTLLLRGDGDVRSTDGSAREMRDPIPGAMLETILGGGHQANVECPDRFNDRVRRFLERVP